MKKSLPLAKSKTLSREQTPTEKISSNSNGSSLDVKHNQNAAFMAKSGGTFGRIQTNPDAFKAIAMTLEKAVSFLLSFNNRRKKFVFGIFQNAFVKVEALHLVFRQLYMPLAFLGNPRLAVKLNLSLRAPNEQIKEKLSVKVGDRGSFSIKQLSEKEIEFEESKSFEETVIENARLLEVGMKMEILFWDQLGNVLGPSDFLELKVFDQGMPGQKEAGSFLINLKGFRPPER